MTKLSIKLIEGRLLAENETPKVKYDTAKAPDGKSKAVGTPKDTSGRTTKITQVDVPKAHAGKTKKSTSGKAQMGIPAARYGGEIVDDMKVAPNSTATNQKSPPTPKVVRTTPNQTSTRKEVKNTIKRTEEGKGPNASTFKQAEMAGKYVAKMPHGSKNMEIKDGGTPEVKAPKAENLKGTTRPARKAASMKTPAVDGKVVAQVTHDGKFTSSPSDAPSTPTWNKGSKGHNVLESVQIVLNGRPKASFDVVSKTVVRKIVEGYRKHGYKVDVQRGSTPVWKSDAELIKTIFESVDAHYNNAPTSSATARKKAMNRFFQISQGDYAHVHESRQDFSKTLRTAFARIMEQADLQYRRKLDVMEGYARVVSGGEVVDIELVTQARDTQMALRQFRDEIHEEFGFGATIRHIFVEGEKFKERDIAEWIS